ncbi:MAG: alpha/beta fold hydrolase [Candidatus Nanopelagicales bacterium]
MLEDRWVIVRGTPVFVRAGGVDASGVPIVHVHGFAISGSYMVPTAELLADEHPTFVPDLPGFGKSPRPPQHNDIPGLADFLAGLLDELGIDKAVIVGNSLGCAILAAFAERHGDRIHRAVMVSPAGGEQSKPLPRAIWQLTRDALREPPSMARVAVPDYVHFGVLETFRLFVAMTEFPALAALTHFPAPLLAVLGVRDPLLPKASRVREVVSLLPEHVDVVVLRDAAHAINYSHPHELSSIIRAYLADASLEELALEAEHSPVAVLRR